MALISIADCFMDDSELFEVLMSSFDFIVQIGRDEQRGVSLYKVKNDEIPDDDVQICPALYQFEGVRPFIISWQ